jgi:hypothetical protein
MLGIAVKAQDMDFVAVIFRFLCSGTLVHRVQSHEAEEGTFPTKANPP